MYLPHSTQKNDNLASESKQQSSFDYTEEESDGRIQGRALASVIRKLTVKQDEDNGPPLTTRAVRELERAQREIVYSETLLQVRYEILCF